LSKSNAVSIAWEAYVAKRRQIAGNKRRSPCPGPCSTKA